MVSLDNYLKNPCGTLSIPYWKDKEIMLPPNMKIVHNSKFNKEMLSEYADEPYFRLLHKLDRIELYIPDWVTVKTATIEEVPMIVDIINRSYNDLSVSAEQIQSYTKQKVYDKSLWILVFDNNNSRAIGCGIAEFDEETKEGTLEWIQVLPEYRGKKIGQLIVNELLSRMRGKATFATVSGKVNNQTKPEILYRKCGFSGDDIWHILYKK